MFYEPENRDLSALPHDPFKALIAPRPISWISTMDASGRVNLAPYSFFNAFCTRPPIVGFSSEGDKDSSTFARESGEFVWNMATYDLRHAMNASSAPLPRGEANSRTQALRRSLRGSFALRASQPRRQRSNARCSTLFSSKTLKAES